MLNIDNLLPDFESMDVLSGTIAKYRLDADHAKLELDSYVAECVRRAYTDKENWINGKPPTQSYIDNVVKYKGNTLEDELKIKELTSQYRTLLRFAEESSSLLETMRNRIQAFQTLSANRRQGM